MIDSFFKKQNNKLKRSRETETSQYPVYNKLTKDFVSSGERKQIKKIINICYYFKKQMIKKVKSQ